MVASSNLAPPTIPIKGLRPHHSPDPFPKESLKNRAATSTRFVLILRRLAVWFFYDARRVWVTIAVIIIVPILTRLVGARWFHAELEVELVYAGWLLQLGGLLTVALGIRNVRKDFGAKSLVAKAAAWLARPGQILAPPKRYVTMSREQAQDLSGSQGTALVLS